jgi:hypothetical protein
MTWTEGNTGYRRTVEEVVAGLRSDAWRGLMHGAVTAGQIGLVLLISGALIAVFAPLTMYLYGNKK